MEREVFILVGSNLGDRFTFLKKGIEEMERRGLKIEAKSNIYESTPQQVEYRSPLFLNCVVKISTSLSPHKLLYTLQSIEKKFGRREKNTKSPRTLDLDILLYGERILNSKDLIIPHPSIKERKCAILPLLDLGVNSIPKEEKNLKELAQELKNQEIRPIKRDIKIKICGITRRIDLINAVNLGVYAVGFILVPWSKRCVTLDEIKIITEGIKNSAYKVVVVADENLDNLVNILSTLNFDFVQLHGDESPIFCEKLKSLRIKIIKTFLWNKLNLENILEYRGKIDAVLIDLPKDKKYIRDIRKEVKLVKKIKEYFPELFIAGDLNYSNVGEFIDLFEPAGVDVATGVESSVGIKNLYLLKSFIEAARCELLS